MKRSLFTLLLVFAQMSSSFGQYTDQVRLWPQVRLQLSPEVTVRDLYEAGLHPYLRPNAENRNLYAKHIHISVIDRDGRAYPSIPADILRTTVRKPWLIVSMEIWTPPLTIKEAQAEMLKWLPITGRSEKELNDFLRAVEADWLHYDVVNGSSDVVRFADGWRDKDGVKKTLLLMKSWQWQAPLRLCFELHTVNLPSRKQLDIYEGSIPPPPGYEGAAMKAPKDWEADDHFIPLTIEPRPAQGNLPPKYQEINDKAQADAAPQKSLPAIQPAATSVEQPSSSLWLVWVVVMVAAIGFLWLFLKPRK